MSTGTGGAAAIVSELAAAGTGVMYGVPGGGPNLDVVGAAAAAGVPFVLTHSESAAVIMAATHADLTGVPGVAVVQTAGRSRTRLPQPTGMSTARWPHGSAGSSRSAAPC